MGKRRLAFKLAWAKTVTELGGSYSRIVVGLLGSLFVSYGAYAISGALGRDWPGDELFPLFLVPLWWIGAGLAFFVFQWLFGVPYEQWDKLEGRISELEHILRPRFSVLAWVGQRPQKIEYGTHVMNAGGRMQTNIPHTNELLCLEVTNIAAVTLQGCEAYLSRLEEIEDDHEERIWQSMRLAFVPLGGEDTVNIPPHGKRSLALFRVIGQNRVHLLTAKGPVKMMHLIQDKGEYQGLVTLTAQNAPAATLIAFTLCCDAPENEPTISIMRRTIGDDDDDTPWAVEEQLV